MMEGHGPDVRETMAPETERLAARIDELEGALHDAEERLHLLAREAAKAAVIPSLQDGFEMLDVDGTIVEVNERFAEIVGWSREEIIGRRPPFPWWPAE